MCQFENLFPRESGNLVLEFWITPFDYAPYDGPERAVVSKLEENEIVGLTWVIIDYDANNDRPNIYDDNGFWSISHHREAYCNAGVAVAFRLKPDCIVNSRFFYTGG